MKSESSHKEQSALALHSFVETADTSMKQHYQISILLGTFVTTSYLLKSLGNTALDSH